MVGRKLIPIEEKLKRYSVSEDDCWIWNGSNQGRYGQLSHQNKTLLAHRASYEFWIGPISPDQVVRHKECDNTLCINPQHLMAGTQQENCQDAVDKGRAGRYGVGDGIIHSVCGTEYRRSPKGQKYCPLCCNNSKKRK